MERLPVVDMTDLMEMARRGSGAGGGVGDSDAELAARVAWFYHSGKLRQVDVAEQLGLSLNKVNRLLAYAEQRGIVRTLVQGPISGCVALEQRLASRFGLGTVRVVPDLGEQGLPLRALGLATAGLLHAALEQGRHRVIGVGHGRTLAAAGALLPEQDASWVEFVALLGTLPCRLSTYPFEVVHRLTDRTGGTAYLIPVPLYAATARDRTVLMRQPGVARALGKAQEATLHVVGIGSVEDKAATISKLEFIDATEFIEVQHTGAVGEILGCYYDADGRKVELELHDRVIAFPPEKLRGREAIGVAGGVAKAEAILAILRTGLLSGLVTTEATAQRLLAVAGAFVAPRARRRS